MKPLTPAMRKLLAVVVSNGRAQVSGRKAATVYALARRRLVSFKRYRAFGRPRRYYGLVFTLRPRAGARKELQQ